VLAYQPRPGAPDQPPEDECDEDRVIELAGDRDEVRHEVERDGQVDEREPGRELPARRDTPVGEEPLEEDGAMRHGAGDHPNVPVAGAERQGSDQRRVGAYENDGNEGDPAHPAAHPTGVRRFSLPSHQGKRLTPFSAVF
jgi:hypothetical protein